MDKPRVYCGDSEGSWYSKGPGDSDSSLCDVWFQHFTLVLLITTSTILTHIKIKLFCFFCVFVEVLCGFFFFLPEKERGSRERYIEEQVGVSWGRDFPSNWQ